LENVPNVVKWALPTVLEDLSKMGYDAAWCVVAASYVGAPHKRSRWFLFAYSNDSSEYAMRFNEPQSSPQEFEGLDVSNSNGERRGEVKSNLRSRELNVEGRCYSSELCDSNSYRRGQYADAKGCERIIGFGKLAGNRLENIGSIDTRINKSNHWEIEPGMGRMVDGVDNWVHRIRACGNGVVPQQAAYAYSILIERCGF